MNRCDNTSVGVLITDQDSRYLMFRRVRPPTGIAPVAGHIDDHGTAEDAAQAEVAEEVGLTVTGLTLAWHGWRGNACRREPGPRGIGHEWRVFRAKTTGDVQPAPDEVAQLRWCTRAQLLALTFRTLRHLAGGYPAGHPEHVRWTQSPGLEPVWALILADLWVLDLSEKERAALGLAARHPAGQSA